MKTQNLVDELPDNIFQQFVSGSKIIQLKAFIEKNKESRSGAIVQCEYCKKIKLVRLFSIVDFLNKSFKSNKMVFCHNCYGLVEFYKSYIKSARERAIEFKIDLNYFNFLVRQECIYCDQVPEPKYVSNKNMFNLFNGVDRFDPKQGYREGNCVPCCSSCNMMKQGMTGTQFLERINEINKKHESTDWALLDCIDQMNGVKYEL